MRGLSTAAGTLALLVIGSLGRKVGGLRLALMSLLVGGLSGYALYYAQETRPYPLMSLMEIYRLAVRGESPALHQGPSRAMPRPASARREEGEYRQYATAVSSGPALAAPGCSVGRLQLDFHHGLLEDWKERALAGLELGLKGHVGEPAVTALDAPKRHIGELSMENELLRERARAAECRLPLPTRRSRR